MTPERPDDIEDVEQEGQDDGDDATLKPVVIRVTKGDIKAWERITKRRYPHDKRRMSQVIRDLIREDDARGEHEGSGK